MESPGRLTIRTTLALMVFVPCAALAASVALVRLSANSRGLPVRIGIPTVGAALMVVPGLFLRRRVLQSLHRVVRETDDAPPARPAATAPPRDEVIALRDTFDALRRSAATLRAEQEATQRNVAEMFVNLGRRNQNLLNRTITYLSELERVERDPDVLEHFFRLDHLVTRMRRNAENLLVLAGAEPARTWSRPVVVADVVRSALSEIEQFERVRIEHLPNASMIGAAVADISHLLAELIENATTFSPPDTPVEIAGWMRPDGCELTITDHGIGMTAGELAEANRRIDDLVRFEASPTKVLGLYVVGRLAVRHHVNVRLSDTEQGGITAHVVLPTSALTGTVPELELVGVGTARASTPLSLAAAGAAVAADPPAPQLAASWPPPTPAHDITAEIPIIRTAAAPSSDVAVVSEHGSDLFVDDVPDFEVTAEMTMPSLTKRVPGLQFPDLGPDPVLTAPLDSDRDPERVRDALARLQAGVRRAEREVAGEAGG